MLSYCDVDGSPGTGVEQSLPVHPFLHKFSKHAPVEYEQPACMGYLHAFLQPLPYNPMGHTGK